MPQFVQTEQQKELINSLVQDLPVYRKKMHMSQADLAECSARTACLSPEAVTPSVWPQPVA